MTNLLQLAYVETPCNSCGGTYRVTLYDMLMEHRLQDEWVPGRPPCTVCSTENQPLMSEISPDLIRNLNVAWEQLSSAAMESKVDLRVGD